MIAIRLELQSDSMLWFEGVPLDVFGAFEIDARQSPAWLTNADDEGLELSLGYVYRLTEIHRAPLRDGGAYRYVFISGEPVSPPSHPTVDNWDRSLSGVRGKSR